MKDPKYVALKEPLQKSTVDVTGIVLNVTDTLRGGTSEEMLQMQTHKKILLTSYSAPEIICSNLVIPPASGSSCGRIASRALAILNNSLLSESQDENLS